MKNDAYVINLDEYADVSTHWIALYLKNNEVIYFEIFGVKHEKLKDLLDIRTQKQTYSKYNHIIQ